jgi:hypothetical protein
MSRNFREVLETLVNHRIEAGEDPQVLFEELTREANLVFGRFNLEYELGLFTKQNEQESSA